MDLEKPEYFRESFRIFHQMVDNDKSEKSDIEQFDFLLSRYLNVTPRSRIAVPSMLMVRRRATVYVWQQE
jgi:hypothetical protein